MAMQSSPEGGFIENLKNAMAQQGHEIPEQLLPTFQKMYDDPTQRGVLAQRINALGIDFDSLNPQQQLEAIAEKSGITLSDETKAEFTETLGNHMNVYIELARSDSKITENSLDEVRQAGGALEGSNDEMNNLQSNISLINQTDTSRINDTVLELTSNVDGLANALETEIVGVKGYLQQIDLSGITPDLRELEELSQQDVIKHELDQVLAITDPQEQITALEDLKKQLTDRVLRIAETATKGRDNTASFYGQYSGQSDNLETCSTKAVQTGDSIQTLMNGRMLNEDQVPRVYNMEEDIGHVQARVRNFRSTIDDPTTIIQNKLNDIGMMSNELVGKINQAFDSLT